MGLFDAFKKKKAAKPVQDLETPPMPEAVQGPMQPAPGFEEYTPAPQQSQGSSPQYPQFPPAQQFSQQPMNFPMSQQRAVPQFQPSAPSFAPGAQIPPIGMPPGADMNAQYGEVPEEMPMPTPPEEMATPQGQGQQQSVSEMPQVTLFGGAQEPQQPQFKFYYGPERAGQSSESTEHGEIPFDVTQELLHLPQMHQEEHPELHPEEEEEKPYQFMSQERAIPQLKKESSHISKQFITVATLYEVGEQLVNMGEDLALAKDTAFRLTDLNEQEIEQMVKWQAFQQSMEMRIAEIDKLLFKA
ncbi:hypothetical protein HZC31_02260 [Candidatus Woesearchaeota archaeon]|nr:hypothetical protein [Candidatus Woesearchaeota archaeon]